MTSFKRVRARGKTELILDILTICRNYPGHHVTRISQFESINNKTLREILAYLIERGFMSTVPLNVTYSDYERNGTIHYFSTVQGQKLADLWIEIKRSLFKDFPYKDEMINGISISQRSK